jgi:ubiquinol-cytochrome c reductase cytochrome b subunit
VTWITGLAAFLIILGFSLSGYLLPWDQRAYWATTVTINVARTTPVAGEFLASVLRGGPELGALTLGRWYAVHVFVLPALLALFVVSHLVLMRRHSISGPLRPRSGPRLTFFPWHVMKDTVVMALVFASLLAVAALVAAPLEPMANPADASYVPRPEWYFLSLFQLLKYLPGPLEVVATQVIPGLTIGFLALLPFIDRHPERRPWARHRLPFTIGMAVIGVAVTVLTVLGLRDRPVDRGGEVWGLQAIAGLELATGDGSGCARCHVAGGPAATLDETHIRRDEEWLLNHMVDPVAIAPGVRTVNDRPAASAMSRAGAEAVVAYLRLRQAGRTPPPVGLQLRTAALTFASTCAGCHRLSGAGGNVGPDLTFVGRRRDEAGIREVIEDASLVYGDSAMPTFKGRLTDAQIEALAAVLATRR